MPLVLSSNGGTGLLVGGLVVLGLYFLPFIIALIRGHHQTGSIFIINTFLGWTFIGWIVALAMAASHTSKIEQTSGQATRRCPYCAEFIQPGAIVCRHCGRDLPVAPTA